LYLWCPGAFTFIGVRKVQVQQEILRILLGVQHCGDEESAAKEKYFFHKKGLKS
jgi:hypothetical protein